MRQIKCASNTEREGKKVNTRILGNRVIEEKHSYVLGFKKHFEVTIGLRSEKCELKPVFRYVI